VLKTLTEELKTEESETEMSVRYLVGELDKIGDDDQKELAEFHINHSIHNARRSSAGSSPRYPTSTDSTAT